MKIFNTIMRILYLLNSFMFMYLMIKSAPGAIHYDRVGWVICDGFAALWFLFGVIYYEKIFNFLKK